MLGLGPERVEGHTQRGQIVGVGDVLHRPAVASEPGRHVLGERQTGGALDGDLVVVVDPAQVGQLQVPGQRGGLGTDALHQAAVAAQRVDVVVEQFVAGPVEGSGLPESGNGHPDAGGDPGAQRTGRAFDARGPAVLRVAGALGVQLPKAAQVLQRDRRLADDLVVRVDRLHPGQMQHRIQQRRRVPDRQHEPIPVGPHRQLRVEPQVVLPQPVGHRGQRHRRAGMPRIGRLHRIHRQRANRIDGQLLNRVSGG